MEECATHTAYYNTIGYGTTIEIRACCVACDGRGDVLSSRGPRFARKRVTCKVCKGKDASMPVVLTDAQTATLARLVSEIMGTRIDAQGCPIGRV